MKRINEKKGIWTDRLQIEMFLVCMCICGKPTVYLHNTDDRQVYKYNHGHG